jgi:hypothetical protein
MFSDVVFEVRRARGRDRSRKMAVQLKPDPKQPRRAAGFTSRRGSVTKLKFMDKGHGMFRERPSGCCARQPHGQPAPHPGGCRASEDSAPRCCHARGSGEEEVAAERFPQGLHGARPHPLKRLQQHEASPARGLQQLGGGVCRPAQGSTTGDYEACRRCRVPEARAQRCVGRRTRVVGGAARSEHS